MDHSTHHGSIYIPDSEYLERVKKAAALLRRDGLDALIVNGTESDYANPRYFSGYWPLFERAGFSGDVYLGVVGNSARTDAVLRYIDYLTGDQGEEG